jgi:hypothetical protein
MAIDTNWDFLNQPLQSPRINTKLATDGNESISKSIVNYLADESV